MGGSVKRLVLGLLGAVGGGGHGGKKRTRRRHQQQLQLQTVVVELRVRMDCERCERQVRKALAGIKGVEHVEVNRRQQRVTVTGNVDPHKVLRRAQSTGKKAELWRTQNNPTYSSSGAAHMALYGMGAAQAHDRWAAAAPYQRNPDATTLSAEHISDLFSDDNPNACLIM